MVELRETAAITENLTKVNSMELKTNINNNEKRFDVLMDKSVIDESNQRQYYRQISTIIIVIRILGFKLNPLIYRR